MSASFKHASLSSIRSVIVSEGNFLFLFFICGKFSFAISDALFQIGSSVSFSISLTTRCLYCSFCSVVSWLYFGLSILLGGFSDFYFSGTTKWTILFGEFSDF